MLTGAAASGVVEAGAPPRPPVSDRLHRPMSDTPFCRAYRAAAWGVPPPVGRIVLASALDSSIARAVVSE